MPSADGEIVGADHDRTLVDEGFTGDEVGSRVAFDSPVWVVQRTASDATKFLEGIFVDELIDALADPKLALSLLSNIAVIVRIGSAVLLFSTLDLFQNILQIPKEMSMCERT